MVVSVTWWISLAFFVVFVLLLAAWWKSRFVAFDAQTRAQEDRIWELSRETTESSPVESIEYLRRSRRRDRRWLKVGVFASYIGIFAVLVVGYSLVPGWETQRYDEARTAAQASYAEGWDYGCRFVMDYGSDGTSSALYFGDRAIDMNYCNGLRQATQVRDFWYYNRPFRDDNTTGDEYESIAFNLGVYGAVKTLFAAQPTLCFGDRCLAEEDVDAAMFDQLMQAQELSNW